MNFGLPRSLPRYLGIRMRSTQSVLWCLQRPYPEAECEDRMVEEKGGEKGMNTFPYMWGMQNVRSKPSQLVRSCIWYLMHPWRDDDTSEVVPADSTTFTSHMNVETRSTPSLRTPNTPPMAVRGLPPPPRYSERNTCEHESDLKSCWDTEYTLFKAGSEGHCHRLPYTRWRVWSLRS